MVQAAARLEGGEQGVEVEGRALAEQGVALAGVEDVPEAENVRLSMRREAVPQRFHVTHASRNLASQRQPPPGRATARIARPWGGVKDGPCAPG